MSPLLTSEMNSTGHESAQSLICTQTITQTGCANIDRRISSLGLSNKGTTLYNVATGTQKHKKRGADEQRHVNTRTGDKSSPQSRRLSRPPAAICAKPASRPRKLRLSR